MSEPAAVVRRATSAPTVLAARLHPGALGTSLAIGFAVTFALGVGFAELLDGVLEGNGLTSVDKPVTRFLVAHRTETLTTVFSLLTDVGGVAVLAPLTAVLATVIAVWSRSWRPIWVIAAALGGVQLLVFSLKELVGRPRPAAALAVTPATGFSFPSGHSTSSFVAFTALAWLAMALLGRSAARTAVWVVAGLLVVGVGASRMYLGVHYLTDVLGAWLLGAVWLSALLTSLAVAAELRARRPDSVQ
jgi:membrane-associated phospholipid phosphatase